MVTGTMISELEKTATALLNYTHSLDTEDNPDLGADYRLDLRTIKNAATRFLQDVQAQEPLLVDATVTYRQQVRHDLRNILNLLIGYSQIMLREGEQSPLTLLQYGTMQSIYYTSKALLEMVNAL